MQGTGLIDDGFGRFIISLDEAIVSPDVSLLSEKDSLCAIPVWILRIFPVNWFFRIN
jgi:hypothetical protein